MVSFKNRMIVVLMLLGISYAQGAEKDSRKQLVDTGEGPDLKRSSVGADSEVFDKESKYSAFKKESLIAYIKGDSIGDLKFYFKLFPEEMKKESLVHWAAYEGRLDSLRFFVEEEGLLLTTFDRGIAPFHVAKSQGVIDYFLDNGVDVNVLDHNGETILFYLVKKRSIDLIEYLVSRGADPSLKNNKGETAQDKAKSMFDKIDPFNDFDENFISYEKDFNDAVERGLKWRLKE